MAAHVYPFTTFNFAVEIYRGEEGSPLVNAAFAECDGLEMSLEVKTIREGGANDRQIRLNGPVAYGQLTLKRGMTDNFELWDWFKASVHDPRHRARAEVVLLSATVPPEQGDKSSGRAERAALMRFQLSRCVPIKLKAPALNAKDGQVAIEELQIAYETLMLQPPKK